MIPDQVPAISSTSLNIQRSAASTISFLLSALSKKGAPAHASAPKIKTSSTWCCCPSLRWHYPDQVQPVGGDRVGHPLSSAFPSSPGEQDTRYLMTIKVLYRYYDI